MSEVDTKKTQAEREETQRARVRVAIWDAGIEPWGASKRAQGHNRILYKTEDGHQYRITVEEIK